MPYGSVYKPMLEYLPHPCRGHLAQVNERENLLRESLLCNYYYYYY